MSAEIPVDLDRLVVRVNQLQEVVLSLNSLVLLIIAAHPGLVSGAVAWAESAG